MDPNKRQGCCNTCGATCPNCKAKGIGEKKQTPTHEISSLSEIPGNEIQPFVSAQKESPQFSIGDDPTPRPMFPPVRPTPPPSPRIIQMQQPPVEPPIPAWPPLMRPFKQLPAPLRPSPLPSFQIRPMPQPPLEPHIPHPRPQPQLGPILSMRGMRWSRLQQPRQPPPSSRQRQSHTPRHNWIQHPRGKNQRRRRHSRGKRKYKKKRRYTRTRREDY